MLAVSSQENPSTLGAHITKIRVLFIHMPLYFERPESREMVITIENTCTSNNTQRIVTSEVTVNEKKEKDKKKKEKKDNKENRNSARAERSYLQCQSQ
jgi:hypothetical protein